MRRVERLRHVIALALAEFGVECQPRHADDSVHRRADFVAHVGEESALRLIRRDRRVLGTGEFRGARNDEFFELVAVCFQFDFGELAFGDVLHGADHADRARVFIESVELELELAELVDPAHLTVVGAHDPVVVIEARLVIDSKLEGLEQVGTIRGKKEFRPGFHGVRESLVDAEHLVGALRSLPDSGQKIQRKATDARDVLRLAQQVLLLLQLLVGDEQRLRALVDAVFQFAVEYGERLGRPRLSQMVEAGFREHADELRAKQRYGFDVCRVDHRQLANRSQISRLVVAKLLRLRAEEIKVGLFGQELAGEHVGQVLAFNVDRHDRIDQPVRAACADKMAGFEHGLQPILVTLDAAAARFRIGAMEFLAGVLPIVADDFGAVDVGDRKRDAHDPAKILDQELQSRDVDEIGELDAVGHTHDDTSGGGGLASYLHATGTLSSISDRQAQVRLLQPYYQRRRASSPPAARLASSSRAPCSSAMRCTMVSPRPLPSATTSGLR